jgi:hypothetical protein
MHCILIGGTLVIANLDVHVLRGLDRARCPIRILYHGLKGYWAKPPKEFAKNMLTEKELCKLLSE